MLWYLGVDGRDLLLIRGVVSVLVNSVVSDVSGEVVMGEVVMGELMGRWGRKRGRSLRVGELLIFAWDWVSSVG